MIGCNPRKSRADGCGAHHLDRGCDEHVIEAQHRGAGVKSRLRFADRVGKLRIPEASGEKPVGARIRRRVEIAQQDCRVAAIGMADPFTPQ